MQNKSSNPLISVVVPIYKVEQYLEKCILSILNQTYRNLEIILVDDGSPDSCGYICDNFALKDSRIKVIHKHNGGLSSARNAGLAIATGSYIGFVDSDDYIHPKMYQSLIEGFDKCDNVGVVECKYFEVKEEKEMPHNYGVSDDYIVSSEDIPLFSVSKIYSVTVWNKLYKRELLDNLVFYEGLNSEDNLFTYDMGVLLNSLDMNFYHIDNCLYYYRVNRIGSITNDFENCAKDALKILDIMYSRASDNSIKLLLIGKKINRLLFTTIFNDNRENINSIKQELSKISILKLYGKSQISYKLLLKVILFKIHPTLLKVILQIWRRLRCL